tara:strand:- start:90 stop:710 length:621 start_codon:yes stop_codon:yes gene_type:complete
MFKNIKSTLLIIVFIQLLYPSMGNNMLKSLALPGLGELSMNENSRAKFFFTSEVLILSAHFLGKNFSNSYIDQYTGFAELHADVDMENRGYDFIIDISNYDSMTEHDETIASYHGEDFSNYQYDNQSDNWEWDSTDNRLEFDKMRRNSLVAGMVADFALAGLIINRIISVIDVMYLTNRKSNIDLGSYISRDRNDGVALNISFSIK